MDKVGPFFQFYPDLFGKNSFNPNFIQISYSFIWIKRVFVYFILIKSGFSFFNFISVLFRFFDKTSFNQILSKFCLDRIRIKSGWKDMDGPSDMDLMFFDTNLLALIFLSAFWTTKNFLIILILSKFLSASFRLVDYFIKFRYSEKATKIWPIFHFLFHIT